MIVGLLGEIRPYKNVEALRHLPLTDPKGRPLQLVVAGALHVSCDIDNVEAIFSDIGPHRLRQIDEQLLDERLSELIKTVRRQSCCPIFKDGIQDLLCSPWLAVHPCFVPACRCFAKLKRPSGPPWVYIFDHNGRDLSRELHEAILKSAPVRDTT